MRDCKQYIGLLWLLSLSLPMAASAQSSVYRWQDANGTVHYGDQPASDARNTKMVEVDSPALGSQSTTSEGANSNLPDYVIAQKRLAQTMEQDRLRQQARNQMRRYSVSSGYRGYSGPYPGYTPGLSVPTSDYCRSYADASCNPEKISGPIYDGPPRIIVNRYGYHRPAPEPTQIIPPDRYSRYPEPRVSLKP